MGLSKQMENSNLNMDKQINENKCTGFGGVPVHFIRILSAIEKGNNAISKNHNSRLVVNEYLFGVLELLWVWVIASDTSQLCKITDFSVYAWLLSTQ